MENLDEAGMISLGSFDHVQILMDDGGSRRMMSCWLFYSLLSSQVFELQPDIAWDKGKAVLWLLDKLITAEDKASLITTTNTTTFPADAKKQGVGAAEASIDVSSTSASGHSTSGHGDDGEDGEQGFFTIFIGDDKTDEVRENSVNEKTISSGQVTKWAKVEKDTTVHLVYVQLLTSLCCYLDPRTLNLATLAT